MPINPKFNDEFHVSIESVKNSIKRPTWSVVIPTYNCANYLRETLASVFNQNHSLDQMEIIVVDDCSTEDNPKNVVDEFETGTILFYQHQQNVGKSLNYSKGIAMSTGHYIHLLHGDDTVNNGFYFSIEKLFRDFPTAGAAFCRSNYMNSKSEFTGGTKLLSEHKGILENFQTQIATWQCIQPPSIVFKREVYETLGTYDLRLKYIEDWEFYVRTSVYYEFVYTPEILANYRIFAENSSSQSMKGGKRVATVNQVLRIMDAYLPKDIKEKIIKARSQAAALYLLNFIPKLVGQKDLKGFLVTTNAFFKYNRSARLWGRWIRFTVNYRLFS